MQVSIKNKCTAIFLSFVIKENRDLRENLFLKCFPEFEILKERNTEIDLHLAVIDNSSIPEVRERIKQSRIIDSHYLLDKNMFDTALFCAGLDASNYAASDFILFTYDDFSIYDQGALTDVLNFMEQSGADCTRITEYRVQDRMWFDSDITPKSVNPDAIRHTNSATGQKVSHESHRRVGNSDFFLTNWHYTSRPCIWRASKLREILSGVEKLRILQGFEDFMVRSCQDAGVVFATLDLGMMRTFPVNLSARTAPSFAKSVNEASHLISSQEMKEILQRCRTIKVQQ